MSRQPARPRGRPRDPEVDAAILHAALEEFLDRGIEGMSIEQVARRAGVGKVTIYRRWASKEEMVARAIESARGDIPDADHDVSDLLAYEQVARALPAVTAATIGPRFRALVSRVFGSATSHPSLMATYWQHYIAPRRAATRVMIERAIEDGLLSKDTDIDVLMDMMVGAVMYRVIQPDPPDADGMRDYLERVYRQAGLLPPR